MKKILLTFTALCFLSHAATAETVVPQSAIKSLNVTVYNNGLGLIKDARSVDFTKGKNTISFMGVSAQIQPETALFSGAGLTTLEQNFNFDLLSRHSLLKKYLGKQIQIMTTNPGNGIETKETATVLSIDSGLVLKVGDRIETDYTGRLFFPDVPANLRDKPTLTIDVNSFAAGKQDVQLSYLTNGLTWRTDYVAELNNDETALNLNGWVTLTNTSGVDYLNADMQFVAGTINRVAPPRPMMMKATRAFAAMDMMAENSMSQEQLMDYHLYSLGRKTDILSNQTKQLALLSGSGIKAEKEYKFEDLVPRFRPRQATAHKIDMKNASVSLKFDNAKTSNLGLPLPAGTIRVYKGDSKQRIFFVGEDRIPHTPENEKVKLTLGEAFDVTVTGKETNYVAFSEKAYEASYELTFKNAKDIPVNVEYYQSFPEEWTVTSSITSAKPNSGQALWTVSIPAKGQTVLTFTVRVRMP